MKTHFSFSHREAGATSSPASLSIMSKEKSLSLCLALATALLTSFGSSVPWCEERGGEVGKGKGRRKEGERVIEPDWTLRGNFCKLSIEYSNC